MVYACFGSYSILMMYWVLYDLLV